MSQKQTFIRNALIVVGALSLGACATLDSVRLRFTPDRSGIMTMQATTNDKFGSSKIPDGLANDIGACGIAATTAERSKNYRIDASLKFVDPQSLQASIDCFPADWSKRQIDIAVTENFWSTDYTATVWLEQPQLVRSNGAFEPYYPAKGKRVGQFVSPLMYMLPLNLAIEMPANITEIENFSALHHGKVSSASDGNVAKIDLAFEQEAFGDDALAKIAKLLNDGGEAKIPVQRYHFVIHAKRNKFEIGSIGWLISLFGLIFGSGIGIQVFGWVKARKAAKNSIEAG
jgi:hypothetical protein